MMRVNTKDFYELIMAYKEFTDDLTIYDQIDTNGLMLPAEEFHEAVTKFIKSVMGEE